MSKADYITNQEIMLLLAKRIKEYRLAARMSQKEMAEKSGVSLATISHFEQGVNQNMPLNNFISLLRIIGMEQRISDLLPELPMPPMALKQLNKFILKRVRRNNSDTKS
ncbi:helix-turn-helix domain-containing protein [Bacteroides fragilis]|uniref:helix-turn-helix domain-containing protein n=1 Tax=Bacteroides fragilis TaxID=817 RepID=UPI003F1F94C8